MNRMKEWLAQAEKLATDAKALIQESDSPESFEKAEKMLNDAQELRDKAAKANEVVNRAEQMIGGGDDSGNPTPRSQTPPRLEKFTAFNEFLESVWKAHPRHGNPSPDSRLKWFKDTIEPGERKDMAEAVGGTGGFLVPTEFMPDMQAVTPEENIVRQRATVIRMARRQITMPVLDQTGTAADKPHWFGGMDFYWQEEASEKTATDANFRQVALTAHKLIGYTRASDELVDDSAVSLADFINGPLGFAGGVMWMEDYAFLRGTGVGQPTGVIDADATYTVARQQDSALEYLDFANMLAHLLPQSRSNAVWVINVAHQPEIITLEGPSGNPSFIWNPNAASGIPDTLLGRPVIWTEKTPSPNNKGDILLADFRYYLIGDRQATTIESTQFDRWRYDQTSWRAVHRVDGQPWLSAPITLADGSYQIAPFVVLGDKST